MRGKANLKRGLLCVLFVACPAGAKYGGGSGTAEDMAGGLVGRNGGTIAGSC